jgi:hypothetical protein
MIGKATFVASKAGGKAWTKIKTTGQKVPSWVKSNLKVYKKAIKDLKGPITKRATKVGKHITKHKGKYTAGAVGLSSVGLYSAAKSDNLGKLKKSDPRYKELKRKGFI